MAVSRVLNCRHPLIVQLLDALGVDNDFISRVIIDIPADGDVVVTVSQYVRCLPANPPMHVTGSYYPVHGKETERVAVNPHMAEPPGA